MPGTLYEDLITFYFWRQKKFARKSLLLYTQFSIVVTYLNNTNITQCFFATMVTETSTMLRYVQCLACHVMWKTNFINTENNS
jgi:hypothetical protein